MVLYSGEFSDIVSGVVATARRELVARTIQYQTALERNCEDYTTSQFIESELDVYLTDFLLGLHSQKCTGRIRLAASN